MCLQFLGESHSQWDDHGSCNNREETKINMKAGRRGQSQKGYLGIDNITESSFEESVQKVLGYLCTV